MSNKPAYHQENLRKKLIEAGIQLMNEQGFDRLSLRKIAALCGVSHSAPYRHFTNKEDLLTAMDHHVEKAFMAILQQAVDSHSPHPMVAFGKAYVLFFAEHPAYYTFFTRRDAITISLPQNPQHILSNYRPFILFKEQAFLHLARYNIRPEDFTPRIMSMWAMVHGLAGMATMPGLHYEGDWGTLTESLLKGLHNNEKTTDLP